MHHTRSSIVERHLTMKGKRPAKHVRLEKGCIRLSIRKVGCGSKTRRVNQ